MWSAQTCSLSMSRWQYTGRLLRTVRYLRPGQVFWRIYYRVSLPKIDAEKPAPALANTKLAWMTSPCREPSLVGEASFCFLGEEGVIERPQDWNGAGRERLWLYNLHYFDDLNARDADARRSWHERLMQRWISDNPPAKGVGWEPYPTSLRLVNWIKWALAGNELPAEALQSLGTQARCLRQRLEYHLLGNHLLANAKALVFTGCFFSGNEAQRWYQIGMTLMARELEEQVLADGGHFERSPMYHLIVLEDLLDLINIHRVYGLECPAQWQEAASRMLAWSGLMRHPDGGIPFFNDAAFGIAPEPAEIDRYACRLGLEPPRPSGKPHQLVQSGYARVRNDRTTLLVDMAPLGPDYLPGHAHADTLSFECSIDGQRVFVNSGTSCYGNSPERLRQRGTAAHNCLLVDERDSSEVWGGFRVGRRANVRQTALSEAGGVMLTGVHDGYSHLSGRPMHRRTWQFSRDELVVVDELTGCGRHRIAIAFHLHPDCHIVREQDGWRVVSSERGTLLCWLGFDGPGEQALVPSTFHPRFGQSCANQKIVWGWEGSLPMRWKTIVRWEGK